MNSESASFILKTSDLPTPTGGPTGASGSNSNGSTNNSSGSSYTWSNIDMRTILGTMYDKYDEFNIGLVSVVATIQPASFTPTTNNDKLGILYMSGLKWLYSNYDTGTKSRTNNACIGYINFTGSTTAGSAIQFTTNSLNTISKPNPICNLTIFFNNVSANVANSCSGTGLFPPLAFQFIVYPVIKEIAKNNESEKEGAVNHRMIM